MEAGGGKTEPTHAGKSRGKKRNTNLKGSSSTSIVWVLELIDRTLVYRVVLLQIENEDRTDLRMEMNK